MNKMKSPRSSNLNQNNASAKRERKNVHIIIPNAGYFKHILKMLINRVYRPNYVGPVSFTKNASASGNFHIYIVT